MRPTVTNVRWSVGLSVTIVSTAKTAEPIEMPFGLWTRLNPRTMYWMGIQIPQTKGTILRQKRRPIVKYMVSLPYAVKKRLKRLRCCLAYGLGWAQGSVLDGGARCHHLLNMTEPCMCGGNVAFWPLVYSNQVATLIKQAKNKTHNTEKKQTNKNITRMWANAQRHGRHAEHRWRPLFNAAKFGWRSLLDCCAVTMPRRESHRN